MDMEIHTEVERKNQEIIGLKEMKDKLNFDFSNLQKEHDVLVSENEVFL